MSEPVFEKWTDEQCRQLKPAWELSRVRRDSHHLAYRFYNKYNTIVTLPPILIGAILSTLSFNPNAVPNGVSAGLAMFITAMATINSFFGLSKSQEGHRQSYRMFNALVRDIEMNIIRGKELPKRTFIDFMEYVNEQFSKTVEDAPTLNPEARKLLETYRETRETPFDKLIEGDTTASGYDSTLAEENEKAQVASSTQPMLNMITVQDTMSNQSTQGISQQPIIPASTNLQSDAEKEYFQQMASNLQGTRRQFTALRQTFETQNQAINQSV